MPQYIYECTLIALILPAGNKRTVRFVYMMRTERRIINVKPIDLIGLMCYDSENVQER